MSELRLGDVIDDYCSKCRRITNHSIVSIVDEKVAKVRCRSCYFDHYYQNEQIPPSKKDLKKQALFETVLTSVRASADQEPEAVLPPGPLIEPEELEKIDEVEPVDEADAIEEVASEPEEIQEVAKPKKKAAPKKARGRAKKV